MDPLEIIIKQPSFCDTRTKLNLTIPWFSKNSAQMHFTSISTSPLLTTSFRFDRQVPVVFTYVFL